MISQPDPLGIPLMIGCALGFGYMAYRVWFDIENLREARKKETERLPSWFPFRNNVLSTMVNDTWTWPVRIVLTFATLVSVIGLVILVIEIFGN